MLGMPPDVFTFALMPVGFPKGKFGPVVRKPLAEVAFADSWGNHWPGGEA